MEAEIAEQAHQYAEDLFSAESGISRWGIPWELEGIWGEELGASYSSQLNHELRGQDLVVGIEEARSGGRY